MALKNNKSLGQHWLKNRAILDQIADLAVVPGVAQCLEIGPGLGTLTSSLLRRFARVVAVEFDANLAHKLPGSFPGKNLTVVNADILSADFAALTADQPFVVAGNIPYYITSPIIKKLLTLDVAPAKIVLLIQKEVAMRLAAEPGDYSPLALYVQNLAEVELGPLVPAAEFTPPPKVDSQVVVLTPLAEPQIDPACLDFARQGFASPRKKLIANLVAAGLRPAVQPVVAGVQPSASLDVKAAWRACLTAQGINPDARAEDLSLWDWEALAAAVKL